MLGLIRLLAPRQRRRLIAMALVMLIISALEVISTGAMFPVVAALVNNAGDAESGLLASLRRTLDPVNDDRFVLMLAVALLAVIVVKTLVVGFGYRFQYRLAYDIQRDLANLLLRGYVNEPFARHLGRNPAELIKNVQNEVPALANGILIPTMLAASESLIAGAILLLLLVLDPMLTLALGGCLGAGMWAIYRYTRQSNDRYGANRSRTVSEMYRIASTLLSGLKELRVLGREQTYLSRYATAAEVYGRSNAHIMLMSQIPRLGFELLTFSGFVGVLAYIAATSGNMRAALPLLATYAVGAFRLMPAFGKIVGASMQLRFYRRTLDLVRTSLSDVGVEADRRQLQPAPQLAFQRELRIEELSYRYPSTDRDVLRGVTMTIPHGEAIGVVGPSGAGKSTLIDVFLGLLEDHRGRIVVDGRALDAADLRRLQAMIGYVPQSIYLADDSVRRNIAFGVPDEQVDEAALRSSSEAAQLTEVICGLPQGYDTVVGERGVKLSGGQRQRIGIARALYRNPKILVLDEATSALDGLTELEIAREIDLLAGRTTMLIIAHRLSTIQKCSRIYVLENGTVTAQGTYGELSSRSEYFSKLLQAA